MKRSYSNSDRNDGRQGGGRPYSYSYRTKESRKEYSSWNDRIRDSDEKGKGKDNKTDRNREKDSHDDRTKDKDKRNREKDVKDDRVREKDGRDDRVREKDGRDDRAREKDGRDDRVREKDGRDDRAREKDGRDDRAREKDGRDDKIRVKDSRIRERNSTDDKIRGEKDFKDDRIGESQKRKREMDERIVVKDVKDERTMKTDDRNREKDDRIRVRDVKIESFRGERDIKDDKIRGRDEAMFRGKVHERGDSTSMERDGELRGRDMGDRNNGGAARDSRRYRDDDDLQNRTRERDDYRFRKEQGSYKSREYDRREYDGRSKQIDERVRREDFMHGSPNRSDYTVKQRDRSSLWSNQDVAQKESTNMRNFDRERPPNENRGTVLKAQTESRNVQKADDLPISDYQTGRDSKRPRFENTLNEFQARSENRNVKKPEKPSNDNQAESLLDRYLGCSSARGNTSRNRKNGGDPLKLLDRAILGIKTQNRGILKTLDQSHGTATEEKGVFKDGEQNSNKIKDKGVMIQNEPMAVKTGNQEKSRPSMVMSSNKPAETEKKDDFFDPIAEFLRGADISALEKNVQDGQNSLMASNSSSENAEMQKDSPPEEDMEQEPPSILVREKNFSETEGTAMGVKQIHETEEYNSDAKVHSDSDNPIVVLPDPEDDLSGSRPKGADSKDLFDVIKRLPSGLFDSVLNPDLIKTLSNIGTGTNIQPFQQETKVLKEDESNNEAMASFREVTPMTSFQQNPSMSNIKQIFPSASYMQNLTREQNSPVKNMTIKKPELPITEIEKSIPDNQHPKETRESFPRERLPNLHHVEMVKRLPSGLVDNILQPDLIQKLAMISGKAPEAVPKYPQNLQTQDRPHDNLSSFQQVAMVKNLPSGLVDNVLQPDLIKKLSEISTFTSNQAAPINSQNVQTHNQPLDNFANIHQVEMVKRLPSRLVDNVLQPDLIQNLSQITAMTSNQPVPNSPQELPTQHHPQDNLANIHQVEMVKRLPSGLIDNILQSDLIQKLSQINALTSNQGVPYGPQEIPMQNLQQENMANLKQVEMVKNLPSQLVDNVLQPNLIQKLSEMSSATTPPVSNPHEEQAQSFPQENLTRMQQVEMLKSLPPGMLDSILEPEVIKQLVEISATSTVPNIPPEDPPQIYPSEIPQEFPRNMNQREIPVQRFPPSASTQQIPPENFHQEYPGQRDEFPSERYPREFPPQRFQQEFQSQHFSREHHSRQYPEILSENAESYPAGNMYNPEMSENSDRSPRDQPARSIHEVDNENSRSGFLAHEDLHANMPQPIFPPNLLTLDLPEKKTVTFKKNMLCPACPKKLKRFQLLHDFKEHWTLKHEEYQNCFPCPVDDCSQAPGTRINLFRHLKKKHGEFSDMGVTVKASKIPTKAYIDPGIYAFDCSDEAEDIPPKGVIVFESGMTCKVCKTDVTYEHEIDFRKHWIYTHEIAYMIYNCPGDNCNETDVTKDGLREHFLECHTFLTQAVDIQMGAFEAMGLKGHFKECHSFLKEKVNAQIDALESVEVRNPEFISPGEAFFNWNSDNQIGDNSPIDIYFEPGMICPICQGKQIYSKRFEFRNHWLRSHTEKKENERFPCPYAKCTSESSSIAFLKYHYQHNHNRKQPLSPETIGMLERVEDVLRKQFVHPGRYTFDLLNDFNERQVDPRLRSDRWESPHIIPEKGTQNNQDDPKDKQGKPPVDSIEIAFKPWMSCPVCHESSQGKPLPKWKTEVLFWSHWWNLHVESHEKYPCPLPDCKVGKKGGTSRKKLYYHYQYFHNNKEELDEETIELLKCIPPVTLKHLSFIDPGRYTFSDPNVEAIGEDEDNPSDSVETSAQNVQQDMDTRENTPTEDKRTIAVDFYPGMRCPVCEHSIFKKALDFRNHWLLQHTKSHEKYPCPFEGCNKKSAGASLKRLKQHYKVMHNGSMELDEETVHMLERVVPETFIHKDFVDPGLFTYDLT